MKFYITVFMISLFICYCNTFAMDSTVFHDVNILKYITKEIVNSYCGMRCSCTSNIKYGVNNQEWGYMWSFTEPIEETPKRQSLIRNLRQFSRVNKTVKTLFYQEKMQQYIVDCVVQRHCVRPKSVAQSFRFTKIFNQIDYFYRRVKGIMPLHEDELKENVWYLNQGDDDYFSVLDFAIHTLDVEKVKVIYPFIYKKDINSHLIKTTMLLQMNTTTKSRRKLYDIINHFLEKEKISVYNNSSYLKSALMYAVFYNSKKISRLLLSYGANPHDTINNPIHGGVEYSIFAYERGNPKGWLQRMYKDIENQKSSSTN